MPLLTTIVELPTTKKAITIVPLKTITFAIKLDYTDAYYSRGETWLHLKEWEKAKADLITAKKLGVDIVAAFRNDCKSIAAFERNNLVKLPKDIEMPNPSRN